MTEIVKIFCVGNSNVGKTSILNRSVNNLFRDESITTSGIDFYQKEITIDNQLVKIQLWDTAGQEKYKSLTTSYYKNANCILLVFSFDNIASFEKLNGWISSIKDNAQTNTGLILVGNKYDIDDDKKEISSDMSAQFAMEQKINYIEVSAKENSNIANLIDLATRLGLNQLQNTPHRKSVYLKNVQKEEAKKWC